MTDQAAAPSNATTPARPLHVLSPLIQKDLKAAKEAGREAAERACLPYYQAAGEKMLEAKAQVKHGEFRSWVERNFKISYSHAHKYMQFAAAANGETSFAKDFSSLSDFIRKETGSASYNRPLASQAPFNSEANLKRAELERRDERAIQREMAMKLIDIGYKVLAKVLHPDKKTTGSREAMSRLNAVRARLKLLA